MLYQVDQATVTTMGCVAIHGFPCASSRWMAFPCSCSCQNMWEIERALLTKRPNSSTWWPISVPVWDSLAQNETFYRSFQTAWIKEWFLYRNYTGAKTKNLIFEKCEFCEKWDFENVNFVRNEILKMCIWWEMRFSKCEFCEKLDFQNVNFVKSDIFKMLIFG